MYTRIPIVRQKLLLIKCYVEKNREKIQIQEVSIDDYLMNIDRDLDALDKVERIIEQKIHVHQNIGVYVLPYL